MLLFFFSLSVLINDIIGMIKKKKKKKFYFWNAFLKKNIFHEYYWSKLINSDFFKFKF